MELGEGEAPHDLEQRERQGVVRAPREVGEDAAPPVVEQDVVTTLAPREGSEVLTLKRVACGKLAPQLLTEIVQVVWHPSAEVL